MKTKKIDVQEAIDAAKKVIDKDASISASAKIVVKTLIEVASALQQQLGLNSSNSSKPPSSDSNQTKQTRFKQYPFELIAELKNKPIEANKLYLQLKNNEIVYQCLDQNNTITQGIITVADLPSGTVMPTKESLSEFVKIRKIILSITADRGDTKPLRKPGGQSGRKGKTLMPVDNPDEIQDLLIDKRTLPSGRQYTNKGYTAKQVVEIHILRHVIEYRAEILEDNLGNEYQAEFPNNISRPIQYGASVKARSTFSSIYQLIPYERLEQQFNNEYNIPLSIGSIYNFNKEASNKLLKLGFDDVVKKELSDADVGNVDETGINIDGGKIWLHGFSNDLWTWLEPHEKRGIEAMNAIEIIPNFRGVLCHDHWKPYFSYQFCSHSLCNAHHLRELTWSFTQDNQQWAKVMHDFLVALNKEVDATGKGCLSEEMITMRIAEYRKIIADGEIECPAIEPAPGKKRKPKQGKSRNLLVRLRDYEDEVLLFMKDPTVSFTNNLGERDLRMIKVHQKISGCFKTIETSKHFCRIRSYLSTCQKHGISATEALELLFNDQLPKFIQDKIDQAK